VHIRMFLSTVAVVLMSVLSLAQLRGVPEDFTAVAVPASNDVSNAGTVLMSLDRWSMAAEHSMLARTLREKGPSAVLDELRNMRPVGTIRTPDSPGYELRYAQQTRTEDGRRRIVLATDAPIGSWEACHRPRLVDDSPFTVIQMHIDAKGRGTGTMSVATKIRAYDNSIEFEDLASCRVMLTDILAVPDDECE
jgi:hypothetical protein